MSYNFITKIIQNGGSSDEILAMLRKASPSIAKKIQRMILGGFGGNEILSFLRNDKEVQQIKPNNLKPYSPAEIANASIVQNQMGYNKSSDERARETLMNFTKQAANIGTTIAGLYGGGKLLSSVLGRVASNVPALAPLLANMEENSNLGTNQSQPISSEQIPEQQAPISNTTPQTPQATSLADQLFDALSKGNVKSSDPSTSAFLKAAKKLRSEGQLNTRDEFNQLYGKFVQLKDSGKSTVEIAKELFSAKDKEIPVDEATQNQPQASKAMEQPSQKLDESQSQTQRQPEVQGNLVLTPQGDIGEVEEVKNGIAKVKVGEGFKTRKDEELIKAPEDLEPAVQHIFDNIPEEKKSTKFQTATHLTIPKGYKLSDGSELSVDIPIMLNKFYDGKIAYYLDFPEDKYRAIAQGLYEAKGEAKTGIAAYKPGVVESRGRGHHEEIIENPKYAKDNKGKTWGYALNEYDAFSHIQDIINKISRLRRDEKGNIIQPKKRKSNKKSPR